MTKVVRALRASPLCGGALVFRRMVLCSTFVLVLMAALSQPLNAQDKRDGHYWRAIPETEKLDILLGLFDGMALSESLIHIVIRENYSVCTDVIESIMAQTAKYMDNVTTAQLATGLDTFYEDAANRNIPIFWGTWVIARQIKGDKNVNTFIKELRRAHK
ncbi:MAG: hypothetical protein ACLGSA_00895 [Acidobacteriota bacterium]